MSSRRVFVVGVCILAVVSIAVFYFLPGGTPRGLTSGGDNQSATSSSTFAVATTSGDVAVAREVPDGWREYRSSMYSFSLLYPQELAVNETPEGGGATTFTFQNVERGDGFQIFIVPYGEAHVSEARFKKDIPSGVRTDLTNITVDGAVGAAFYSKSATLGDTREGCFIYPGPG